MNYTIGPAVHKMRYIDRVPPDGEQILVGGLSFAGLRGIRSVRVRADQAAWAGCGLQRPLSSCSWTRWMAGIQAPGAALAGAGALGGLGHWRADGKSPIFPDRVKGPTTKTLS